MGDLAAVLTVVSILWSATLYITETPDRNLAAILDAWNTVTRMEGKRAEGGRIEALHLLADSDESLAGVRLDGAMLRGLRLDDTDLSRASLRAADFRDSSFRSAYFHDVDLTDTRFRSPSDFAAARFDLANLAGADFVGAVLTRATFTGVSGDDGTSFNGAEMTATAISTSRLPGAVFDNAILSAAQLLQSDLRGASFFRVTAERWIWIEIDATGAHLEQLRAPNARFGWNTSLASAHLDRAVLSGAVFENVNLTGAVFFGARLEGVRFRHCNLTNADFTSATIDRVIIEDSQVDRLRLPGGAAPVLIRCSGVPGRTPEPARKPL